MPRAACEIEPVGPYDLRASLRGADRVTLRPDRDGALLRVGEVIVRVRQRPDGRLELEAEGDDPAEALEAACGLLGVDEDHRPFLEAVRRDDLLSPLVRRSPGLRPVRVATIAHAALRAFAGQLITFAEAQRIERDVVRAAVPAGPDGLRRSPTAAEILALGTARVAASGLAPRRAEALMRLLRTVDLERLRGRDADVVAARLAREPQVGPWTIGVIGIHGYGWPDRGLVGDLGLMRLAAARLGREPTVADTERLLEPYAPWRALASVHLLGHPLARTPAARTRRRVGSAPETI